MKITLIQDIIYWADIKANLQKLENQVRELVGKTDLVVLPEMFSTGFCTTQPELAEGMDGETVRILKRVATQYNLAIAGSFIATESGFNYNRGFFVFPDGQFETADKRHLFSIGGEHRYFRAGDKKLIVNYKGFNICLLICYDLRFPVWARNVDNAYDLLIYVANFPKNRIRNWDILLQARAIENQAYVCGVNRVGTDGSGIEYNGHSVLLDFLAQPLLSFNENEMSVQTFELDKALLDRFRTKSAFWKDADRFMISED
jgi:predicted amidohydrolase